MYYSCNAKVVKFYDGTSWINLAEAAEASGQIVMFESTCPSGWTEATDFRSKFPRGDDDGWCSAGGTGGSDTVSVTVDIGSFTSASCGSHAHGNSSQANQCGAWECGWDKCTMTAACGAHTHSINPPSTASTFCSNIPAYREVVFCKKD